MNATALTRLACALALFAACACGGSVAKAANAEAAPQRSDRNVLAAEEIMKTGQATAYRAIQAARPQWLIARRQGSSSGRVETIKVYVAGNRYGEAGALEQITAASVKELRYLDSRDATTRYGTGHGSGAIMVTLR